MSDLNNGGMVFFIRSNFLMTINYADKSDLVALLDWAKHNGFVPFNPTQAVISEIGDKTITPLKLQSNLAPVCPVHGQPMRPSQGKGWFCPRKVGGEFCKVKADQAGNIT